MSTVATAGFGSLEKFSPTGGYFEKAAGYCVIAEISLLGLVEEKGPTTTVYAWGWLNLPLSYL